METSICNTEIEAALLGAMMLDASCVPVVRAQIAAGDFHASRHQRLFNAILKTADDNDGSTDPVLVGANFSEEGASVLIADCQIVSAGPSSVPEYIAALREYSGKRNISGILRQALSKIQSSDLASLCEGVSCGLKSVLTVAGDDERLDMAAATEKALGEFRARQKSGGGLLGPSTGFYRLDRYISGLRPSALTIVAGRPGHGKTSLALQIAESVARQGKGVLFLSLEMTRDQLLFRLAAQRTGISASLIEQGKVQLENQSRIEEAIARISSHPFTIVDRNCSTLPGIERIILLAHTHRPVSLVVIDYAQLIRFPGSKEPRNRQLGIAVESFCEIAKSLNCHIILCSQLNRGIESRAEKLPQLSDLKESGDLEQAAAHVLFVHRPDLLEASKPGSTSGNMILAKNRFGDCGRIKIFMRPETTSFLEEVI